VVLIFFFSSRRRHTRSKRDWSSDVCSSDLGLISKLDNKLTMFNLNIESMKNMQVLLADLALDAEEKYYYGLDKYFLWDNNEKLQVVADLMFRVVMESKEEYQEIEDLKNKLFELTKVGVIDED